MPVPRRWLDYHVLPAFGDRVLAFDPPAARILGAYRVPEHAPLDDALVAAVTQANEMTVATRNIQHFEPLGIQCLNPWIDKPQQEAAEAPDQPRQRSG